VIRFLRTYASYREGRTRLIVSLVYLAAVTVNELLTTLARPQLGLVLHGALLVIILLHTAFVWDSPLRDLLLSLSFAPLIRLLSLSLPLFQFPLVYWYFITSVPLFVAVFITMRTLRYNRHDVGIRFGDWPLQVLLSVIGLLFGWMEHLILAPDPLAKALTLQQIWLPALILMVSTGFAEEVIFRGIMQRAAGGVMGPLSVPYVAFVFAVLHVGYKSLLDVIFVFGVAIVFGYITDKTRSIVGVSLAHGVTNIMLFLVAPFLR